LASEPDVLAGELDDEDEDEDESVELDEPESDEAVPESEADVEPVVDDFDEVDPERASFL
jgi:hypothetical protein